MELLRTALAGWQGEPLSGLPGNWAARTRAAWRQEYPPATRMGTAVRYHAGAASYIRMRTAPRSFSGSRAVPSWVLRPTGV
jgi:hypothetical protein